MLSWINALQLVILCLLLWFIVDSLGFQNPPKIRGLLSIPGYPVVGNLLQVLENPSLTYSKWSDKYNASVFQIRLGCVRAVVVNKYQDVENLWSRNIAANNSRPLGYTFHNIVSSTQGLTIGTSPYDHSYIKKKKAISSHMNQVQVDLRSQVIGAQADGFFRQIICSTPELTHPPSYYLTAAIKKKIPDIDLMPYAQKTVLSVAVYLAYGITVDCFGVDEQLAATILKTENGILHLRSPVANLKDYLPFLRVFGKDTVSECLREERDKYMDRFWIIMVKELEMGNPDVSSSIAGQLYTAMQAGNNCLSVGELKSICLSLVSAGLDNTPLNYTHLMGHLSMCDKGADVQEKAYQELMKMYENDVSLAWNRVASETTCEYVLAMIQETLRIFTVLPLALPRTLTKDVVYKGVFFPKGTTLIMNAYHANHDPDVFENPDDFIPERWLHTDIPVHSHLSFGAGARQCSGSLLAIKEMYVLTARTILMFHIRPPANTRYQMQKCPFAMNKSPRATSFEPRTFKVRLEPRCSPQHECLYNSLFHMH